MLSSNLCRCTGYQNIIKAVKAARDEMRGAKAATIESRHTQRTRRHYPIAPPSSERRVLGHSVPRIEDLPLVTGQGRFAGDINFPHQLHMRIVRSGKAHGRIVSVDTRGCAGAAGRGRGVDQ